MFVPQCAFALVSFSERKSIYRLASKFVLFRFVCFLCLGLGFGKFEPAGSFFPRLASSGLRVRQGLRSRGGPFRGRPEVVNPAQALFRRFREV